MNRAAGWAFRVPELNEVKISCPALWRYQSVINILLLLFTTGALSAQTDRVFQPWDLSKPVGFPGGPKAFDQYFRNIPYPSDMTGRPGGNRLVAGFVVEPDGSFSDLRIFQTPGPAFTGAVTAALQSVKWMPAEANGNPVRQLKFLCFLFHHPTKKIAVQEHGLSIGNYAELQAIDPADYSKLGFPTGERFMGYNPEDTLAAKQEYPEAAKAAGIQGEVVVTATLQPNGNLTGLALKNDIGYGCGEEALRLTRLLKNWVPAQAFDSVYATPKEFTYSFCADPAAIESSDRIFAEGEIFLPASKYTTNLLARDVPVFLSAHYVLGKDFELVPYNNTRVEIDFVVEKNGKASAIDVRGSASENHRALARRFVETMEWSAPRRCNCPCRMRFRRFLYFHRGVEENSYRPKAQIIFSKTALPAGFLQPPDIRCDTLFEPAGVDQPAVYKFGYKSIEELVVLRWPRYKSEIPPGGEILIRVLVPENGAVEYMELLSGVGAEVDKKALAVFKMTERWTPAYKNGRAVSSWQLVRVSR